MEHAVREPIELTELELDAVAGGAVDVDVDVLIADSFNRINSEPVTAIATTVNNSVNVSF